MSDLDLKNLERHKTEILKAEVGALLFNFGKTHVGFWKGKNGKVYFHIDDDKFKEKYGYKPFSGYRDYFKKTNKKESKFDSKSPFTIDMDSINEELKDFFNEDINLPFAKNDKTEKNLRLIDVLKGDVSDSEFIKKIMFKGCENINSGIDKGAPKEQLNNLKIANAFGTTKEEIANNKKDFVDLTRYDESRIIFLRNLWMKIDSMGRTNIDVYEMRRFILGEIKKWYSHLLSDSRFPINDVTLWDQAYMTASMFKASVAALCLEEEKYQNYIDRPREIKWSILGVQYDKLGLAEKALNPSFIDWYRNGTNVVDEKIKKVIEEDFALGNEIYRDETGIYFIAPENIYGEKVDGDVGLYRMNDNLSDIQEKIIECFKLFNGEVFPSIYITEPSRGTMNIAYLIENAKENFLKPVFPKSNNLVEEYFQETEDNNEFKVICDICKVRLAEDDKSEKLNLCSICKERKNEIERTKLNDEYKETIWTGELQDKNRRIALVTMKFELDEWLNGNMVNTMLISDYDMRNISNDLKNDLKKNEIKTNKSAIGSILYKTDLPPIPLKKYAESILLERSIGDRWEKLLKDELEDNIDFENRKIKWAEVEKNDEQIEFLSKILLQFVTRKNPSPARFRRIWETTEEFFVDIENHMMDILEISKSRNVRIKWNKVIEEDKYKGREFEYKGLNFLSDAKGNLYLISSIEKAIPIISKEKKENEEIYSQITNNEGNWITNEIIEMIDVSNNNKCKVELKNPKYISYKPYLSIINPTPISWQFIVPAEYVPKLIKKVQHKYDEEFKYVKGKLPLHIGIVFQDYKKPLYIGIKALRNIRRDIDNWDSIDKEISGERLKQMSDAAINNSNSGCENRTELKRYYSLYPLNNGGKGDYDFYIKPNKQPMELKSVDKAKDTEKYLIYPNTIDFEYLDVNTRRNDICYDTEKANRNKIVAKYKQNRPYTWEEWETFNEFYDYFKGKERKTKLQTMVNLIYSKLSDWQDNSSLKCFILSAFINIFELNDAESKNKFARILGENKWGNIESLCDKKFRIKLHKFLDMYDFWHNGLKEI